MSKPALAVSLLFLLLAPSTTAARVEPSVTTVIHGQRDAAAGAGVRARKHNGHGAAVLCGRPLDLRFHRTSGDLYIADAYAGLMRRSGSPTGWTSTRRRLLHGQQRRVRAGAEPDDDEARAEIYDPRTGRVTVLMSGLAYPNGVAVSEDRTHTSLSRSPDRVGCSGTGLKGPRLARLSRSPTCRGSVKLDGKGGY
jgi:hypothetical protein